MEDNNQSQPPSTPPPLPPSPRLGKSSAERAAQFCLFAPFIAFGAGATSYAVSTSVSRSHQMGSIMLGLSMGLVAIAGLTSGIIALCGIRKQGAKGILGRAITGLVLSAFIGLAAVGTVTEGFRENARAANYQKLQKAADELHEANRKAIDSTNTTAGANERLAKFKKALDQGVQGATGDDALMLQAASSNMAQMQEKMKPFQAVSKELMAVHVLQPRDIQTAEDFEPQKKLVQKFLDANEELRLVCTNLPGLYRVELKKRHLPEDKIEIAVRNYSSEMQSPELIDQVRDCDRRMGERMLDVINLLQSNWGKWKYDPATLQVIFYDNTALQSFNAYVTDIQAAGNEQVALQRQLLK